MKTFTKIISSIERTRGGDVMSDFMLMAICLFSSGKMEKQYQELVKQYDENERKLMMDAFMELARTYTEHSSGGSWFDGLGRYYEEFATSTWSRQRNGQFFTPENVCDLMARITGNQEDRELNIADPSCGSGRCLIAYDRVNPKNRLKNFYTAMDIDSRCVQMCTLNFLLYGMSGVVVHMDTLRMEVWSGYRVHLPETGLGIQPLTKEECWPYVGKQMEPVTEKKPEQLKLKVA